MKHLSKLGLSTTLALSAAVGTTLGGNTDKSVIETAAPASTSPWEFRLEPYGWLTDLNGSVGVGGMNMDVNAPFFNDILDSLKMFAALQAEARYDDKWGLIVDGFYADIGGQSDTPGPDYDNVSMDLKQFIGQAAIAYRVYETPKGFVDVFAGVRYTHLDVDLGAVINPAGVAATSANISSDIFTAVESKAKAIVEPRIAEYQSALASERAIIEGEISQTIRAGAKTAAKDILKRQLVEIRRGNRLGPKTILFDKLLVETARERVALTKATAELKVAELRASVDSKLQSDVVKIQKKVAKADKKLGRAIDSTLQDTLPTQASGSEQWVDPIVGFRGQYNINDRWYLAGNGDVGGFGVSSDLTWSLEGVVGYNFNQTLSGELGYRYMYTDYKNGGFSYDMDQHGIYAGLNIKF